MFETTIIGDIRISTFSDLRALESDWKELERSGLALALQHYDFCKAWIDNCAAAHGIQPIFLSGHDAAGKIQFILPFQKRKIWNSLTLEWLGQQGGTACCGLFVETFFTQNGAAWFSTHITSVLKCLGHFDAIHLRHMPATIEGSPSPLAILHKTEAANASFILDLQSDYSLVLSKKRSSRSISKMRRRDERLEGSGNLLFEVLHGASAFDAIADGLHHKNIQLKNAGIGGVFDDRDIKFYQQLLGLKPTQFEVFRLKLDDKTLATMAGARVGDTFWLLISALAPDIDLQFSPGDYLLRRTIAHCCTSNISTFDFSLGEQDYKLVWADSRVLHFNFVNAQTWRGKPLALALSLAETSKRVVKQTPSLRNAYFGFRQRIWGEKTKP